MSSTETGALHIGSAVIKFKKQEYKFDKTTTAIEFTERLKRAKQQEEII